MSHDLKSFGKARTWAALMRLFIRWERKAATRVKRELEQPKLWALALIVGVASGHAAIAFVLIVEGMQELMFGGSSDHLYDAVSAAHPLLLLLTPIFGGLVVGLFLYWAKVRTEDQGVLTPYGVAEVIEARALFQGRIHAGRGLASTFAAALSLGFGASAGREGPAVVAGAAVSSFVSQGLHLTAVQSRTLLGCAVAAAVSASFNAPIAGALFALEVVLGHYALRAFAPITIASVAGAVISRTYLGEAPAFTIPHAEFGSYAQFPAFFLLGLVSAAAAVSLMVSIQFARDVIDRARGWLGAPGWMQPVFGGVVLGIIAVAFPHVLSVGYQTTSRALSGVFDFWDCVLLGIAKGVAVSITLGSRFAGGVFSPALMIGALTGAAFGLIATDVFPSVSGTLGLYALAGMGAVSGAVLGAPISTTLIVFELTGDYGTAIAVMVSTSVATVATQQSLQRSFFHLQLKRRGLDFSAGPQAFLLRSIDVGSLMRPRGAENSASDTSAWALVEQGVSLRQNATLAQALPMFRGGQLPFLPVIDDAAVERDQRLVGALFYVDALRAYNRALVEVHEEEHS